MEHYHCKNERLCPGLDCPGCKDGKKWCKDPRCAPDCPDCTYPEERDRIIAMVMVCVLVILILLVILFVMGFGHNISYMFVPDHNNPEMLYGRFRIRFVD